MGSQSSHVSKAPDASRSSEVEAISSALLSNTPEANSKARIQNQNHVPVSEPGKADTTREAPAAADQRVEGTLAPQISKNQLKKLKRKREWEEGREDRRAKRREKNQERRERKRTTREEQAALGTLPDPNQARKRLIKVPITIVIDCDFEHLMAEREQISLSNQVTRCYSDTRKALFKPHMVISSFKGNLRERYEKVLNDCHKSWHGVSLCEADFVQAAEEAKARMASDRSLRIEGALRTGLAEAPPNGEPQAKQVEAGTDTQADSGVEGEVVYLSSEAAETLYELKPYSTYIIGGLVDKNRHKGVCHKRAQDRNVRTARLPIDQYLKMDSRQVLATNHVNEIMVRWLELGDWGKAFMEAIPRRKGGVLNHEEVSLRVTPTDDAEAVDDVQTGHSIDEDNSR